MGRNILITGCSSGIGLCAAKILKNKGYNVFTTAPTKNEVADLETMGFESIVMDLADSYSIQKAVNEMLRKTNGTLDALFNNAGYAQVGAVEDLTRDLIRKQFEVNVFGTIELTNLIIPIMRKQGYGRIIQNSSINGLVPLNPYFGAYCSSKFALEGFYNCLRLELCNSKIFISLLNPGPVDSNILPTALALYKKELSHKKSVHSKNYQALELFISSERLKDNKLFLSKPEAVVKKLIHALESKSPKVRYYVGLVAPMFAFFRRVLPDAILYGIIAKLNNSSK